MTKGKKPAGKFGGRPVERVPEHGKRTHLSLAVPLTLKRRIEQAAAKRGWSVSAETALRLEQSFDLANAVEVYWYTRALQESVGRMFAKAQGRHFDPEKELPGIPSRIIDLTKENKK